MSATNQRKGNGVAIVTMFFLFAMIAFVTNLAAPVGTIWKNSYSWAGMLGNLMNFAAYLFMGIPAGLLISRIGYKHTALWAMAMGMLGLLLQWLSGWVGTEAGIFMVEGQWVCLNFLLYLLGAFICGFCVCMLNTVVNPMLNTLGGGGNQGNQLVQIGGACNSLAGTLTPLFVGVLVGTITAGTSIVDVNILLYIAFGIFAVGSLIISRVDIPNAGAGTDQKGPRHIFAPLRYRHCLLGVVGIFFYVGLEVGIPGVLIFFLSDAQASGLNPDNAMAIAGNIAAIYWLLMLVGRLASSLISGKVSSRTQLVFVSTAAILLVVGAILLPTSMRVLMPAYSVGMGFTLEAVPIIALLLVLCGLCTSLMWGAIFNLSVEGLGQYTAQASGIFMMMVVGGGVMPLIQEAIANAAGYFTSYWLVVAMFAYLLFYALIGSRTGDPTFTDGNQPIDERDL